MSSMAMVPEVVELLDVTAQRLHAAAGREGVDPGSAARMRRLADDLSSHALAARVLASSGASSDTLDRVLQRAVGLIDDDTSESVHPQRSVS